MMIHYYRQYCLPVLSLLCTAAWFTGASVVHAGTIPHTTAITSQLPADENSSSPARQIYSRTGAEFDLSDSPPEITEQAETDASAPATVDINTASVEELAAVLPGIGPGKAQRIVDWREANGPFQFTDQLLEVSGIGPVTLENIRPLVRVGDVVSMQRNLRQQSRQEQAVILALVEVIGKAVQDRADVMRDESAWQDQNGQAYRLSPRQSDSQ